MNLYDAYQDTYTDIYGLQLPSVGHISVTTDSPVVITVSTGTP